MSLVPMTPAEVLAGAPAATENPRFLRLHDGGLACPAGENAWLHATPNADGSWNVVGRLGAIGVTEGRPVWGDRLTASDEMYSYFADASSEPRDPAFEIVSAISGAARTVQTKASNLSLLDRFPDLVLTSAGGMCPFQAEGTLFGLEFYFRYRHSYTSLRVGGDLSRKTLYTAAMEFGDFDDQGVLDGDEFADLMTILIPQLERAPIYWEFPGVENHGNPRTPKGAPTTYGAWGHTPAEAWADLHAPSEYLRKHGYTDEKQAELTAAKQLVNVTITTDDRQFPDPEPDWANAGKDT